MTSLGPLEFQLLTFCKEFLVAEKLCSPCWGLWVTFWCLLTLSKDQGLLYQWSWGHQSWGCVEVNFASGALAQLWPHTKVVVLEPGLLAAQTDFLWVLSRSREFHEDSNGLKYVLFRQSMNSLWIYEVLIIASPKVWVVSMKIVI